MHPDCFQVGISGFPSWWQYEAFEQCLFRKPPDAAAEEAPLAESAVRFACPACREVWVLSEPERAWRGCFLPMVVASPYGRRPALREKTRRLGGFGLLLAATLYCGWRWW
jgi:hypothetical protein